MELNFDPAVMGLIGNVGWLLTEIIIQSLSEYVLVKHDERKLRERIGNIIKNTITNTVSDIPGFELAQDGDLLENFLGSPTVIKEFKKLLHHHQKPEIDILCAEWERNFNIPIRGNTRLLIELTISRLEKRLWEIPELQEILHIRETHGISEKLDIISHGMAQIGTGVNAIEDQILDHKNLSFTEGEYKLNVQLDTCKNLLDNRRPNAALDILIKLEESSSKKGVTTPLLFRLLTLIGGCYYSLEKEQDAITYFNRAYLLDPENPRAISNAALAALLSFHWVEAEQLAQKALEVGDDVGSARAILTIAIANQTNYQHLDDLVNEEYFENQDYIRNLGFIFLHAKQYSNSEKFLRLCLARNPEDIVCIIGLIQIIMDTRLTHHQKSELLPDFSTIVDQDALDEAFLLANKAYNEARKGDNNLLVWQALNARSTLFARKGDFLNAKLDCERVLSENPEFLLALHNRAVYASIEKDYQLAIDFFERLPREYQLREDVVFAICRSYMGLGRTDDAHVLLQDFINGNEDAIDNRVLIMKAWILFAEGKSNEIDEIIQRIFAEGRNVSTLMAASEIEQNKSNFKGAVCYLEEAYCIAEIDEKNVIGILIAFMYFDNHQLEQAYQWFIEINIDFAQDKFLARAFVQSAYAYQDFGQAYETAKECRERGISDPVLINFESWLAEYLGDLETALKLQFELVRIEPDNVSFKIQLARLLFRTDNKVNAIQVLEMVDQDNIQDPFELMQMAEIYGFIEEPDIAIRIAYIARRKGIDNPELHLAYLSIFMRISDSLTNLEPKIVEANTSIRLLTENSSPCWMKVITFGIPDKANWEFRPETKQGKLLLGKQTGDTVIFREGPLEELSYTIELIQSIYLRAYQETYEEFSTRFPDHPGLHRMEVKNDDFSKFFTFIIQHSYFAQKVYSFYKNGVITVENFAKTIGRSYLEVFSSLQNTKKERIFACNGTNKDQQEQLLACKHEDSVALDLSSFLTLGYLEFLDLLCSRFKHIYITQRFIDTLDRALMDCYFDLKKGRRTIGINEYKPFFEEFSPSVIENNITYVKHLLNFAKNSFEVVAIPTNLAHYLKTPENPSQEMGDVSISTILIAKHTNSKLFSDDKVLKEYSKQVYKVQGFWSQPFLIDAVDKKLLTFTGYSEACIKLIKANYYFLSLSSQIINQVIELNHYLISPNVRIMLTGLRNPVGVSFFL